MIFELFFNNVRAMSWRFDLNPKVKVQFQDKETTKLDWFDGTNYTQWHDQMHVLAFDSVEAILSSGSKNYGQFQNLILRVMKK